MILTSKRTREEVFSERNRLPRKIRQLPPKKRRPIGGLFKGALAQIIQIFCILHYFPCLTTDRVHRK